MDDVNNHLGCNYCTSSFGVEPCFGVVYLHLNFCIAGVAQNPMFTPEYICQDKIIQYRCVLNSPLVQLIAEPLISATGTPLVIDSSVDVPIPDVLDSSGNSIIKVKQICEDPFTITMAISTSLSEISQVTCVDIGIGTNTSLEHTLGKFHTSHLVVMHQVGKNYKISSTTY